MTDTPQWKMKTRMSKEDSDYMGDEDKAARGGPFQDASNFYYRQQGSYTKEVEEKPFIPENIRKGQLVEVNSPTRTLPMAQADIQGRVTGKHHRHILQGETHVFFVVRTDTSYHRWMDVIWGEEIYRLNADKSLWFKLAQDTSQEAQGLASEASPSSLGGLGHPKDEGALEGLREASVEEPCSWTPMCLDRKIW